MQKQPSYSEAVAEVEAIIERLEADEVDVDDLAVEVKRAVELVDLCREKLRRTELEVKDFVDRLEREPAPANAADPAPDAAAEPDPDDAGGGALPF